MTTNDDGDMMDLRTLKADTRKQSLGRRDALPVDERIEKSMAMADLAAEQIEIQPGDIVSGFFPIRSEADIRPLMHRLKKRGARLCVPAIIDKQTIVFRELVDGIPLVDTGFGTMAPGNDAPELDPAIMLVPLSAFDAEGNRIGYGAGYYDRAIARLHGMGHRPHLIGVAFDCQQVASVPCEPHDVRLDAMLTESGLRHFGKAN